MAEILFNVNLDLVNQYTPAEDITVVQEDNQSVKFLFSVLNRETPVDLISATDFKVSFVKQDGNLVLQNDATLESGKIALIANPEAFTYVGKVYFQVNYKIGTANYNTRRGFLWVERGQTSCQTIKSTGFAPYLDTTVEFATQMAGQDAQALLDAKQDALNAQQDIDLIVTPELNSQGNRIGAVESQNATQATQIADNANEIISVDTKVDDNQNSILYEGRSYVRNGDFVEAPFVTPRSTIYSFLHGVSNPSHKGNKSYQINCVGFESSSDPNKDFAFVLTDNMTSADTIMVDFWVYPTVANKTISVRMAFSSGKTVNLGAANQWNHITVELPLSAMTSSNNYLYFNMLSSFTMYMSEFTVQKKFVPILDMPDSFRKLNNFTSEINSRGQNSKGAIENLIANAQTYAEQTSNLVYGNSYTAYDTNVTQVGGKYQIDCSSFANLMVRGVPWQNSRYIPTNTINKDSNDFFLNMNPYEWRYANQMGRYAYEYGYSYKPNADLSNVQPGDILFFHWNNWTPGSGGDVAENLRANNFMGIDHVAVVLHRKNESRWATLQFDTGISTVYYEASNEYMSQAVLGARFPLAHVDSKYSNDNLLRDSNAVKTTGGVGATIGTYNLTKPLEYGKYYTIVFDGNITTEGGYFTVSSGGQTVFSDGGKIGQYNGLTYLRFPCLVNTNGATTVSINIGAPAGTAADRQGTINWATLYEGYVRNKPYHVNPPSFVSIKDFPLDSALVSDVNTNAAPYYKYTLDGNKLIVSFSLTFNTNKTGTQVIGVIPSSDRPSVTQRIPVVLISPTNTPLAGALQVSSGGNVSVVAYNGTDQWKAVISNGIIFR